MPSLFIILFLVACLLFSAVALTNCFSSLNTDERFVVALSSLFSFLFLIGLISYETIGIGAAAKYIFLPLFLLALRGAFVCSREIIRNVLVPYSLFSLGAASFLFCLHNYSGNTWYGDWYEHFQRALFFLGLYPPSFRFLNIYDLPARPPLPSIISSWFLAVLPGESSTTFAAYQLLTCLLGCMSLFPALMFVRKEKCQRSVFFVLPLFFLLNPMVLQNLTFSWTRMFCNFFILAALAFYVRAFFTQDRRRYCFAWWLFGAAIVTHYSAVLYFLVAFAHALFVRRKNISQWYPLLLDAALGVTITVLPWVLWSHSHYGFQLTCCSNTTWIDSSNFSFFENVKKIFANIGGTFFPFFLFDPHALAAQHSQYTSLWLREIFFPLYQLQFPFALGLSGLYLLLLNAKRIVNGPWFRPIIILMFLGPALIGSYNEFGLAHIQLQPLVMLGLVFASECFLLTSPLQQKIFWALALVDITFGIVLHFYWQSQLLSNGNLQLKEFHHLLFVADILRLPFLFCCCLYFLLLLFLSQRSTNNLISEQAGNSEGKI